MAGSNPGDDAVLNRPAHGETGAVAICVDLDGTLVKSDTLIDSVLALAVEWLLAVDG